MSWPRPAYEIFTAALPLDAGKRGGGRGALLTQRGENRSGAYQVRRGRGGDFSVECVKRKAERRQDPLLCPGGVGVVGARALCDGGDGEENSEEDGGGRRKRGRESAGPGGEERREGGLEPAGDVWGVPG